MTQEIKQEDVKGQVIKIEDFLQRRIIRNSNESNALHERAKKLSNTVDVEKSVFAAPVLKRSKAKAELVNKDIALLNYLMGLKGPNPVYSISQKFVQPVSPWWNGFRSNY